jgi:ketosteroid isomerase-like protein
MRLSAVFVLSVLAVACAPRNDAPAALSAADIDAVKAVDAAFAAGMNARDSTAVFAVYAPDAQVLPEASPILEGGASHPVITGMIAAGPSDFVLTPISVNGVGDVAYTVGKATYKIGGVADSVKYAEVLRKGADGKWRYVVDMFSSLAAPAPAPAKK